MRPAAPARSLVLLALLLLGLIWGGSFALQRVAAPVFGPLPLVCLRLALGAATLLPTLWRNRRYLSGRLCLRLAAVGLLSQTIPFVLFAWGAERAPAAIGAMTNSLTAPFAALVGLLAFREPLSWRRASGIAMGFAGVVLLVGVHSDTSAITLAALAGVAAALCYAVAAQLVARLFTGVPPAVIAGVTLLSGAALTALPAMAMWPVAPVSTAAWISTGILGVLCTGLAYAVLFWLIGRIGAARATAVTYLIPLFGVLIAWIGLGEQPRWNVAVAGTLIIAGVALSQTGAGRKAASQ